MNNFQVDRRQALQDSIDKSVLLERDATIGVKEREIAKLKSLLQRCFPVVLKDAQNGSSDSEFLKNEIEVAVK